MPCDPHDIPGAQISINLLCQRSGFLAQTVDFVAKIQIGAVSDALQLFDFHLELSDGLLKV